MPACMDCVFVRGTDSGAFECRKSAPTVNVIRHAEEWGSSGTHRPAYTSTVTLFPAVDAFGWCGEFKDALAALVEKAAVTMFPKEAK